MPRNPFVQFKFIVVKTFSSSCVYTTTFNLGKAQPGLNPGWTHFRLHCIHYKVQCKRKVGFGDLSTNATFKMAGTYD